MSPVMNTVIPRPSSVLGTGRSFELPADARILVQPNAPEVAQIGEFLAAALRPATGLALPVTAGAAQERGTIHLTTAAADPALGAEGYELLVAPHGVLLAAPRPAGLFRGVQTIRQLLPAAVERRTVAPGPWTLPTGVLRDAPRFAWRGAMLDVARHFFPVADVKRYLDLLAYYKFNVLHLHLTDDQGWRIEIKSWPRLAEYGGSTAVDGAPGGYYTQEQYADLARYAAERYITIVPEIDMPSHTNAALASYALLNCEGEAPALYTGTAVGFSTLCMGKETTFRFMDDVLGELAALTPGPYLHIGGDEADSTSPEDYQTFMRQVQAIVQSHGKTVVGWGEIAQAPLTPGTMVQHWRQDLTPQAAASGHKVILSPAGKTYLDMKYDEATPFGLSWAGYVTVQDAFAWNPGAYLAGVGEDAVAGVEAPLWTETIPTFAEAEFMLFPRLLAVAELGWSPAAGRTWDEFRSRLAHHGPRLEGLGVNFFRAPEIDWPETL
uniref:beta-N-acetylhexosaminidase n=1 Tax=uncultured Actinomycetales bacterium TaxID=239730 RepID=A0A0E3XI19_9ACTO|nr:Hex1 [uncultured Actinomycetales bacterium]